MRELSPKAQKKLSGGRQSLRRCVSARSFLPQPRGRGDLLVVVKCELQPWMAVGDVIHSIILELSRNETAIGNEAPVFTGAQG